MALTAPRYDSTGASVSGMPVPKIAADTSLADSLQAVGDTFASVGKSLGAIAKFKQDADETLAADIAMTLDQRMKAVHDDFGTQAMGNAVGKYDDYQKQLAAVNVDDLLEGKSQGVRDALAKRAAYRRMYYETGMRTHATVENKKYIYDTSSKEYELAKNTAITANAEDGANPETPDVIAKSTAQAWTALQRRASVAGEKADPDQMMADIRIGALKVVMETKDPRRIVNVYDKFSGKFGPYEEQAKVVVQDAKDTLYVQDVAVPAMQAVSGGGNFNADSALATVAKTLGKQTPTIQEKMRKAAVFLEQQDIQDREALADKLAVESDIARMQGVDATEGMKQKVHALSWRLLDKDNLRIQSLLAGGATGLPEHNAEVEAIIATATPAAMEQLREALNKHTYSISAGTTRKAQAALANFEDVNAKKIAAARAEVFKMFAQDDPKGRKVVMPGEKEGGLDSGELEYFQQAVQVVDRTIRELGTTGKADSPKELQDAYQRTIGQLREVKPGWLYGGNKMTPYIRLFTRPEAEKEYIKRMMDQGRLRGDITDSEISTGARAIMDATTADANQRAEAGAKAWSDWQMRNPFFTPAELAAIPYEMPGYIP